MELFFAILISACLWSFVSPDPQGTLSWHPVSSICRGDCWFYASSNRGYYNLFPIWVVEPLRQILLPSILLYTLHGACNSKASQLLSFRFWSFYSILSMWFFSVQVSIIWSNSNSFHALCIIIWNELWSSLTVVIWHTNYMHNSIHSIAPTNSLINFFLLTLWY